MDLPPIKLSVDGQLGADIARTQELDKADASQSELEQAIVPVRLSESSVLSGSNLLLIAPIRISHSIFHLFIACTNQSPGRSIQPGWS